MSGSPDSVNIGIFREFRGKPLRTLLLAAFLLNAERAEAAEGSLLGSGTGHGRVPTFFGHEKNEKARKRTYDHWQLIRAFSFLFVSFRVAKCWSFAMPRSGGKPI